MLLCHRKESEGLEGVRAWLCGCVKALWRDRARKEWAVDVILFWLTLEFMTEAQLQRLLVFGWVVSLPNVYCKTGTNVSALEGPKKRNMHVRVCVCVCVCVRACAWWSWMYWLLLVCMWDFFFCWKGEYVSLLGFFFFFFTLYAYMNLTKCKGS